LSFAAIFSLRFTQPSRFAFRCRSSSSLSPFRFLYYFRHFFFAAIIDAFQAAAADYFRLRLFIAGLSFVAIGRCSPSCRWLFSPDTRR